MLETELNDCSSASLVDIIYQFAEEKVLAQGGFVTCKNELFARSGYGNVQFAVNWLAVFDERIGSEKFQLEAILNGERIDNDVALATLIAFHRVDTYLVDSGQTKLFQLFSYHRNLVSVGHNDANRLLRIECLAHLAVQTANKVGYNACLFCIYFLGNVGLSARFRGNEYHSMRL